MRVDIVESVSNVGGGALCRAACCEAAVPVPGSSGADVGDSTGVGSRAGVGRGAV